MSIVPVLAVEETLERMSGDKELLANLFILYKTDAPKKIELIHESLKNKDFSQVARLAHSLKGASATVGAKRICQLAIELEQLAKALNEVETERKFNLMRGECISTLEEMGKFVDEFSSSC